MIAAPSHVQFAPDTEPTPMLKFGFYAFCIFNIAVFSRFFEWKLVFLHVPLITSSLALLGAAMDGRLLTVFQNKIGSCMAALTVIYAANIPLSVWRSESLSVFTGQWLKSLIAFMIAGALIVTFKQCRTALSTIGWGAGIASLLALLIGRVTEGRLQIAGGTLANANEMAFILLLGMPFLWLVVSDRDSAIVKRLVALGLIGTSLLALSRTGSRSGLIGISVLLLLLFVRASAIGKIAMVIGVITSAALVISAYPSMMDRYSTLFLGKDAISQARTVEDMERIRSAVDSADGRRKLLIESLEATFHHPLMGVGLGAFGAYQGVIETNSGQRPLYLGTHNTYTQISAEAGIPALLIYIGIMVFIFSGLRRVYKLARRSPTKVGRQVANVSYALISSLVAYSVCIFFDFVAYEVILPMLAGFSIALGDTATRTLRAAEANEGREQAVLPQIIALPMRRPARPAI